MKMLCTYHRVPEVPFLVLPKKGRPHPALLYHYSKKYGFDEFPNSDIAPHTRGGMTTVFLYGEDKTWLLSGMAVCSMSDNFSYEIGRKLALLRATNLGLGHNDLDTGLMFRFDNKFEKMDYEAKSSMIESYIWRYKNKYISSPTTLYFHPETAKIVPDIVGFTTKTSKIILKNHVWIGFEE